ncbi:hypothetical protein [uncultured Serinicoccus sp.]|uniref:hypothetical protein n=1 Tax=uncultured Serinicoccus sp. TaxID=735514 RepID=UPI002611B27E|nr:hypothetical protein [uncultured Serinicoccus sp.]
MSEREIERGFRERFQQAHAREQHIAGLLDRAGDGLHPDQGVCIVLAAVPAELLRGEASFTHENALTYLNLRPPPRFVAGYAPSWQRWDTGQVRKGLRQWVIRSNTDTTEAYRKALHDDGTVLAGYRLGGLRDDERAAAWTPVGQLNHCVSGDVEAALIDFTAILRKYAQERGVHGGYRVRVGLVGREGSPLYIQTREEHAGYLQPEDSAEAIRRFELVTIDLDPLAGGDELVQTMGDLARDVINQGGVRDLRIIAEP